MQGVIGSSPLILSEKRFGNRRGVFLYLWQALHRKKQHRLPRTGSVLFCVIRIQKP